MRYILLLLVCLEGTPPLRTYNSTGVMMPMVHCYDVLVMAASRCWVNSFSVITYLLADALETVCSTISDVMVSFQLRPES